MCGGESSGCSFGRGTRGATQVCWGVAGFRVKRTTITVLDIYISLWNEHLYGTKNSQPSILEENLLFTPEQFPLRLHAAVGLSDVRRTELVEI